MPFQVYDHFVRCILPQAVQTTKQSLYNPFSFVKMYSLESYCVLICLNYSIVLFLFLSLNMKIILQYAQVLNSIIGQFVNGLQTAIKKMKSKQKMVLNVLLQYFKM